MATEQLVSKACNYAHVLHDQGVAYGDYVEQITRLLFLKMDAEREDLPGEARAFRRRGAGRSWQTKVSSPASWSRRNRWPSCRPASAPPALHSRRTQGSLQHE